MNDASRDITEIIKLATSERNTIERGRIIREIADLFISNHAALSVIQVDLFDRIMMEIIHRVDEVVLVHLSKKLAPLDVAPRGVVKRLANDDAIRVAGPMLEKSKCLDEDFLLKSAQTKSQDHLLAISKRQTIGHRITDVLIDRGNDKVAMALAQNNGAQISDQGYSAVIEKAKNDLQLAGALCQRADISRQQLLALIDKASDEVRDHLEAEGVTHSRELLAIVKSACQELRNHSLQMSDAYARARIQVTALQDTGGLSETHVLAFAREGKFEEVAISLSELAHLPVTDIERYLTEQATDRLLLLSRALSLSWDTVKQIIMMVADKPFSLKWLEQLRAKYRSLPRETVAKALQFHQLRQRARNG
jgi:uncharacterized protein (DUF2336 family)